MKTQGQDCVIQLTVVAKLVMLSQKSYSIYIYSPYSKIFATNT